MFCTKCGSEVPDSAKFCTKCGAPVQSEQPRQQQATYQDPAPQAEQQPYYQAPQDPSYQAPRAQQQAAYQAPQQTYQQPEQQTYQAPQQTGYQPRSNYQPQQQTYQTGGYGTGTYQQPYGQGMPQGDVGVMTQPKKGLDKKWIIIIAAAVVVVAVALILIFTLGGSNGYTDYNDLVSDYIDAFQRNDREAVLDMMPPELIDLYVSMGYDRDDYLEDVDYWLDDYGIQLSSWAISDVEEDDIGELNDMTMMTGLTFQRHIDVSVDVVSIFGDRTVFDLQLGQIDGKWYLLYTW